MKLEYRIVRTDESWPEEVRGPIPNLDMQLGHLDALREFNPEQTFEIQERVAPGEWGPVDRGRCKLLVRPVDDGWEVIAPGERRGPSYGRKSDAVRAARRRAGYVLTLNSVGKVTKQYWGEVGPS